jgi:hypothetical protein
MLRHYVKMFYSFENFQVPSTKFCFHFCVALKDLSIALRNLNFMDNASFKLFYVFNFFLHNKTHSTLYQMYGSVTHQNSSLQ